MKIAIWHNLPSGGGKRALHGQVAGLLVRGHSVEVWCPESADPDYLPLSELATEHRLPFPKFTPIELCNPLVRAWRRLRVTDPLLKAMNEHCRRCAAEIAAGGFDVVLAAPCRFYFVPRLRRFLSSPPSGPPCVLYLQEPNRVFYEAIPELPWLALGASSVSGSFLRKLRRRFVDFLDTRVLRREGRRELEDARLYARILVNSFFSRESVARAYGLDARVCYLGIDAAHFQVPTGDLTKGDFIIGLGSMNYIKGVDTAVRAVAALPIDKRLPLVWVSNSGSDIYEAENLALADQLDVRLDVRRRIGDEVLTDLLQRARLLLYTSRLEPFGYAPLEAIACGTPVVAVAEGGVRETVVDGVTGLLCDRDPDELAAAMNRLLTDERLATELSSNGVRLTRERWAMEPSIDRLEAHLRSAVTSAGFANAVPSHSVANRL